MYMEKLFLSDEFKDVIKITDKIDIINIAKKMQKYSKRKTLKCIILDKPRHKEIIETLGNIGIIVRTVQDGDVLAAIGVVNGEADCLWNWRSARGRFDGSVSISSFSKLFFRLISYEKILPNEPETKFRVLKEQTWLKSKNFNFKNFFRTWLINDDKAKFYAAGITAGGTLKPINYKNDKFYVNSFISSHGIVRNIQAIYDVKKS